MKKPYFAGTIILAGTLLLQLGTFCFHSRGAAGDVDLSFDPGSGVNGTVQVVAVQPDGKVIIAGQFTTVKGLARSKVARLNADGSGDSSFNAGTGTGGWEDYAHAVAVQSDGKVLVSNNGGFSRFNSDGSQDTNFIASIDGICGDEGCFSFVYSIAVQSDGKMLVGGYFSTLNGTNYSTGVARLNANGSLDGSFNPGIGAYSVGSVALQSDGKVLIGGHVTTVNGPILNGITRLHANGSLDSSFNPGTGPDNGVYCIALQSDGKVLVGGGFTTVNGANRRCIARLNADGSLDGSFNPGAGTDYVVRSIALQSDGKVLIGGAFTTVNGTNRNRLARLNANGSLDGSFNPATASGGSSYQVNSVVVQSDGKVLIGGDFYHVNGTNHNHVSRFNADGSQDNNFNPGREVTTSISSLVVQPDGKVLIGGPLTFINGTNRYGSARLNVDGSLDSTFVSDSFNPDLGIPYTTFPDVVTFTAVAVQLDGKVLVGGVSFHYECLDWDCIAAIYKDDGYFVTRVNPDGSRDTSFEPALGNRPYGGGEKVRALAVQPDGKIVVGGNFNSIKGTNRAGIARLNANGTLDTNFNANIGPPVSGVFSVVPQADGKLLIGGSFTTVNGTNRNGLARLNSDGSLDDTFNPAVGGYPIALQPDGKVLVGGYARLNADGSLDSGFNPGTGANGVVRSIALQSDGKMLIGGDFTSVNGVARPHVARLYGDSIVVPSLNIARSNAFMIVSWPVTGLNFQLHETTDLSLPNSWSPVAQVAVTNADQVSVTVPATVGSKFFQLKSQ